MAQSPCKGWNTQISSEPSPSKSNRRCFRKGEQVGPGEGVLGGKVVGVEDGEGAASIVPGARTRENALIRIITDIFIERIISGLM